MKLDNLLEQMMMMQQQQQMEDGDGETGQNAQQKEARQMQQQKQQHGTVIEIAQKNVGTAATNGQSFHLANNEQNLRELSTSAANNTKQKSDEFLCISNESKNVRNGPLECQQQQQAPIGVVENSRETLPQQQLEFFSAFLRANLPILSAFSSSSLPLQQNPMVPTLPSPTPQQIVPLSKEIASQGLLAVGGCRPCHKTFTSRLELIHHCVDHFPNIFYSFEECLATRNNGQTAAQQQQHSSPQQAKNAIQYLIPEAGGVNGQQSEQTFAESTQRMDILGQLAGFLALNENGSSGGVTDHVQPFQNAQNSLLANFFKSFGPLPLQQLTSAAENGKHLSNNGPTEGLREQQRKRTLVPLSGASNPKQSLPRPSFNTTKMTNSARKRQINSEKSVNAKRQTEDGPSTSSFGGVNKQPRKNTDNRVDRQQNGNSNGYATTAPITSSAPSSTTATALPTLSELPYHMCPHCCLTFAETSAFRRHLDVHESEVTTSVTVSPAGAPFIASTLLAATNAVDIENGGGTETVAQSQPQTALKCSLCDMKFADTFRLTEHMRLHTAHTCTHCQKTLMTAFDLNLHMGTHTGFTYDCKDCGKCFPCRKTLAEHNRSHRMILSGGGAENASPELPKKGKTNGNVSGQQQDKEHSPAIDSGGVNSGDSGSEKRRMRVAKRGEKSRRNATLVAVESAMPSPPIALPQPATFYSAASSSSSPHSSSGVALGSNDAE